MAVETAFGITSKVLGTSRCHCSVANSNTTKATPFNAQKSAGEMPPASNTA